jgi:hypothetical protein
MIRDKVITVKECTCDVCGYHWTSTAPTPPRWCANKDCRSREWNGRKLPSLTDEIKLPAPRKAGRPKTATFFDETIDP